MPAEDMVMGEGVDDSLVGASPADAGGDVVVEDQPLGDQLEEEQPEGEQLEDEQPVGEGEEKSESAAEGDKGKEILPAALAKAVRELRSASPDHAPAIKELTRAYYGNRAYREVYPTVDDARTAKAAMEAVGGNEGLAKMQTTIDSFEAFDEMIKEGDPDVMNGIAEGFPDGFKKLVPAALDRLSRMDRAAYTEVMRGPLLASLDGDGLMPAIQDALDFMKAAATKPDEAAVHYRSVQQRLTQIVQWYNDLTRQESEFKSRYKDPKVQELGQREQALRTEKANLVRTNVARDLRTYLDNTMRPEISKILAGKTLSEGGRVRFVKAVDEEVGRTLSANNHYRDTLRNMIKRGDVEGAIRFAKPHMDAARRNAIKSVYTDLYGSAPNTNGVRKPAPRTGGQNGQQQQTKTPVSDKPVMVTRKPALDDIDWAKDPRRVLFVTGKAYLKGSGKFVTWNQ